MKRVWQPAAAAHEHHEPCLDCQVLALKRVRLSTSPGELRLERDLHQMAMHGDWKRLDNRRWESKEGYILERRDGPLECVLYMSHHTQVWMQLSRLYPHQPPMITHVVHPRIRHVIVSVESPVNTYTATLHSDAAIVYSNWTPVARLGDLLNFVVAELSKHGDRNVVTPTSEHDIQMQDEAGASVEVQEQFPPNRFDWGYPKPAGRAMEVCRLD